MPIINFPRTWQKYDHHQIKKAILTISQRKVLINIAVFIFVNVIYS